MTTARIKVSGFAETAVGFDGPQMDGLLDWRWPGVDATRSRLNLVTNDAPSIIGSPTYDPAFVQCSVSGGLAMSAFDAPSITMMLTFRREITWATKPLLIGCRTLSTPQTFLNIIGTDRVRFRIYNAANASVDVSPTFVWSGAETWEVIFATVDDAAGTMRVYAPGRSINQTNSYTGPRQVINSPVKVGVDDPVGTVPGPIKVAQAAVWDRALTPAQMDECYDFTKARLLDRLGLAVT